MVLGSPAQRNLEDGTSSPEAFERCAEALEPVGDVAAERGVRLLVEALHPRETNFLQTIEDVLALNTRHGHPAIGYMLDCKAMSGMPKGIVGTTEQYGREAGHFHTNDPSGAGPGMGSLEFGPVLKALKSTGFDGWVSAEPFQYEPDRTTVAPDRLGNAARSRRSELAASCTAGAAGGTIRDFASAAEPPPIPLDDDRARTTSPRIVRRLTSRTHIVGVHLDAQKAPRTPKDGPKEAQGPQEASHEEVAAGGAARRWPLAFQDASRPPRSKLTPPLCWLVGT